MGTTRFHLDAVGAIYQLYRGRPINSSPQVLGGGVISQTVSFLRRGVRIGWTIRIMFQTSLYKHPNAQGTATNVPNSSSSTSWFWPQNLANNCLWQPGVWQGTEMKWCCPGVGCMPGIMYPLWPFLLLRKAWASFALPLGRAKIYMLGWKPFRAFHRTNCICLVFLSLS